MRSGNTVPDMALRRVFRSRVMRCRANVNSLVGKPDIYFQ
ncbi:MAG: very short patch repair endonuclease [Deltaproteobacteria bacterium]|nr:very short patch repair endonuclease [Deltaproteobacteria bacterium]